MVNLAEAWAAVLVDGPIAMILDAEAANFVRAGLDVGNRVVPLVVHHVPGVIADLDALVGDLVNDTKTVQAGGGVAAMLLDENGHAVVARDGAELLEVLDPDLFPARLDVPEGQHKGNAGGGGLLDTASVIADGMLVGHIDARKHHDRLEAAVAAHGAQTLGFRRRRREVDHLLGLPVRAGMASAPTNVLVSRTGQAVERALKRERLIGVRHAGDLEVGRLALRRRRGGCGGGQGKQPAAGELESWGGHLASPRWRCYRRATPAG
ncbi:MAG: hypothetical protein R2748_05285 [Bryobacterales bacterium]